MVSWTVDRGVNVIMRYNFVNDVLGGKLIVFPHLQYNVGTIKGNSFLFCKAQTRQTCKIAIKQENLFEERIELDFERDDYKSNVI